jgi:hypothetical protein
MVGRVTVDAFVGGEAKCQRGMVCGTDGATRQPCVWRMAKEEDDGGTDERSGGGSSGGDEDIFGEDLDTGGVVLEDLSWRVEKLRLEEQNTQRFLKSTPRFLPYDECRRWAQALNRWDSEDDWRNWIAMGEKKNAYIPSRPDEYYGRLGAWVSWEHFLKVDPDREEQQEEEE